MTAQHRAALRALIVGDGETRIDSYEAADRILTWLEAGWMPRPEPGSAEWEAMVERAVAAANAVAFREDEYVTAAARLDAVLRAALYPEEQSNG